MNEIKMRLQKYMAKAGFSSRRKAEEIINQKRVSVNGRIVSDMGIKVSVKDRISVDGKMIKLQEKLIYIMLNKPEGYICTSKDQFDRKNVLELIEGIDERIFTVGRLDYNSTGLLLLTNDGDLTYKLTHPKHDLKKIYLVKVKGNVDSGKLLKLKEPILIDNYKTKPAQVELLKLKDEYSFLKIIIKEGRNRQIRKMCENLDLDIIRLKRISIGRLELGNLRKKMWRHLEVDEVKYLKRDL
ncbi:MAG: pseudouridine synthase [Clostridiales bacterium]